MKKPQDLKRIPVLIRQVTLTDSDLFEEILDLLNRTQGAGLFPPDYLEKLLNGGKAAVFAAFQSVDEVEGQLLATGIAQIIDDFKFYIPFDASLPEKLKGKIVGSFSTLAVHENYQGQGIGQQISHQRMEWLKFKKAECVVGVSWVSGLEHTSNRVFEKLGFKAISTVDSFFYSYSIEKPFDCPGCGGPPCTCPCTLYMKEL